MNAPKDRLTAVLHQHPFRAARGLRSPHAQTLYGAFFRTVPAIDWTREPWPTPDGDVLQVVLREGRDDRPVAVLIHGLEGSVESPYITGVASRLLASGYTVIAYNQRGCGGFKNQVKRLYHCGSTDDIAFVVDQARTRFPGRPIALAGVSLGGNQLGKWLATGTVPDEVRGAVLLSPPFDLTVSGPHMDRNMWLYVRHFLKTLIPKALEKERDFPGSMDPDAIRSSRDFNAYDTHATAALHGFKDATDYYRRVSCGQFLAEIRVPTLILAAQDDPFNPAETIPFDTVRRSEFLLGDFPQRGGHVGFIGGRLGRPVLWAEAQTARFIEALPY
ncbi:MAG: alpha/beta fold hydrolase [Myxococcota bacterium]